MASRVDAIQKGVVAALKKEAAEYQKRNLDPKGRGNKAPAEYLLKIARDKVDASGIRDALVEEALAAALAE